MLNLYNVLWVIPGIIFIYFYNNRRNTNAINLAGWPYIFFLVLIAAVTWIPAEIIFKHFVLKCEYLNFYLEDSPATSSSILLAISLINLFLIAIVIRYIPSIFKSIFPKIEDGFCKKCIEWENKIIILTLRNEKAYIALLWKYPEFPNFRHESQTISIIPLISGYRDRNTKNIIWDTEYPDLLQGEDGEEQLLDMETIIPRTEIITFGKYNQAVFDYFYPN